MLPTPDRRHGQGFTPIPDQEMFTGARPPCKLVPMSSAVRGLRIRRVATRNLLFSMGRGGDSHVAETNAMRTPRLVVAVVAALAAASCGQTESTPTVPPPCHTG